MAIAQTITVVDGKTYQPGEEIWDLGSFACVDVRGNIRRRNIDICTICFTRWR